MLRSAVRWFVLAALLVLAACSSGNLDTWVDGAHYQIEGESLSFTRMSDDATFGTGSFSLVVLGGRLILDGRDLGAVAAGDEVRLGRSGKLTVNGVGR